MDSTQDDLKENPVRIGQESIPVVDEYTYLGILYERSG